MSMALSLVPGKNSFAIRICRDCFYNRVPRLEKRVILPVRYASGFASSFPRVFKIYKLFKDGVRDFYFDFMDYYRVSTSLWRKKKALKDFTYYELLNYRQIPSDIGKVAPVLIISALPLASYVIFPIAYMFPRHLLCRHFWTPEQRLEFGVADLKHRLNYYPTMIALLQNDSFDIKDRKLAQMFRSVLTELQLFKSPPVEVLLDLRPLFEERPFDFESLYRRHPVYMQWHVSRSWNFPGRKIRMKESANLLHHLDLILTSYNLETLTKEVVQQACLLRGLNPKNMLAKDMFDFLQKWMEVSKNLQPQQISLLLHLNVFLTYAHPSNRLLLPKLLNQSDLDDNAAW